MPKKRSATLAESEVAPRRSTRVPVKAVPAVVTKKPAAGKSVKPKGTTTKKPKPDQASQAASRQNAEPQLPPKKKSKVDKPATKEAAVNSQTKNLAVGEKLPDSIILKNHEDEDVNVLDLTAEKGLIVFIYPKVCPHVFLIRIYRVLLLTLASFLFCQSNTPGCTNQACGYRDLHKEIVDAGFQVSHLDLQKRTSMEIKLISMSRLQVVGLSMDSPKAQNSWKVKQKLPYTLLCDPEQRLIKLLGSSKTKSSIQRSHYIFEQGGKLLHSEPKANTTNSFQEALEFIQSLSIKTVAKEDS
ncbi:hypothetical protein PSTT_11529 [Puccinia striiformis]|uniref:Alkyl hydroperoxide reductase subunit C/ Thiol specific antioxidant domain-containing protein n=1 Tax=Puccinia striiformis TaxID=27350 RepID=A0A2S4UZS5_9BASI|nr:hypothetical protein PSTT_11529 [Puccinia striiformis]